MIDAVVLLLSGVLNIAYFWPIVYGAFFEREDDHDPKPVIDHDLGGGSVGYRDGDEPSNGDDTAEGGPPPGGWERCGLGEETTWLVLGPILATVAGAVALGSVPRVAVFLRLVDAVVAVPAVGPAVTVTALPPAAVVLAAALALPLLPRRAAHTLGAAAAALATALAFVVPAGTQVPATVLGFDLLPFAVDSLSFRMRS